MIKAKGCLSSYFIGFKGSIKTGSIPAKVIIDKSRGELSLLEQDTIKFFS